MSQGNKISKEDALKAYKLLEECINQLQIALHLKGDTGNDQSRDKKLWFVSIYLIGTFQLFNWKGCTYLPIFVFTFYFHVPIRNFVINSLRVTNEELKTENTFTLLTKIVEQERERRNEDNGSVSSLNKYKNELSELNKQIAETEASFRTEIQLKRRIIDEQTVSFYLLENYYYLLTCWI